MTNLQRKLHCARLLIATLWVGSLWTIGYVVAPTLFATLADRVLAGTIAASLFRIEAWLSLACALVLLVLHVRNRAPDDAGRPTSLPAMLSKLTPLKLILAMAACTLIGYFGLQPFMATIREAAAASGGMAGEAKRNFGMLHGAASGIFLVQSLLGVALVLRMR